MPLNNKVLGIQDKNNSKEEDRRIQELFSSTRSGAVYLLYTKAQSHWFESTGGHKTKKRIEDTRQRKKYQPEKRKYQQTKKRHKTGEKEERVNCEREMRNEFFPGKKTRAGFWGFQLSDKYFIRNMYRQTYFFSFCNLYLERRQKYFFPQRNIPLDIKAIPPNTHLPRACVDTKHGQPKILYAY